MYYVHIVSVARIAMHFILFFVSNCFNLIMKIIIIIDAVTSKFSSTVTIGGEEFIPFQLQIEYTGLDQSRYLRVITKSMPITKNRSRADRGTVKPSR